MLTFRHQNGRGALGAGSCRSAPTQTLAHTHHSPAHPAATCWHMNGLHLATTGTSHFCIICIQSSKIIGG